MGNQQTEQLQLRESSIMTKIMLHQQQQIIKHIQQQQIQLNRPINHMGDRLIHYAAYKSMYKLLEWLIKNNADVIVKNHRRLTPIDIALPQTREWLYKQIEQHQKYKQHQAIINMHKNQINQPQNTHHNNTNSNHPNNHDLNRKDTIIDRQNTYDVNAIHQLERENTIQSKLSLRQIKQIPDQNYSGQQDQQI